MPRRRRRSSQSAVRHLATVVALFVVVATIASMAMGGAV